ncbi:MAG: hypothetical protein R2912_10440 [Eubacteriales bacterium]
MTLPQNKGFAEYIIAAGNGVLPEGMCRKADMQPYSASAFLRHNETMCRVEYRNGIETVWSSARFDRRLAKADWLIALTGTIGRRRFYAGRNYGCAVVSLPCAEKACRRTRVFGRRTREEPTMRR